MCAGALPTPFHHLSPHGPTAGAPRAHARHVGSLVRTCHRPECDGLPRRTPRGTDALRSSQSLRVHENLLVHIFTTHHDKPLCPSPTLRSSSDVLSFFFKQSGKGAFGGKKAPPQGHGRHSDLMHAFLTLFLWPVRMPALLSNSTCFWRSPFRHSEYRVLEVGKAKPAARSRVPKCRRPRNRVRSRAGLHMGPYSTLPSQGTLSSTLTWLPL